MTDKIKFSNQGELGLSSDIGSNIEFGRTKKEKDKLPPLQYKYDKENSGSLSEGGIGAPTREWEAQAGTIENSLVHNGEYLVAASEFNTNIIKLDDGTKIGSVSRGTGSIESVAVDENRAYALVGDSVAGDVVLQAVDFQANEIYRKEILASLADDKSSRFSQIALDDSGNYLYLGADLNLIKVERSTGNAEWTYTLDSAVEEISSPAVGTDNVYVSGLLKNPLEIGVAAVDKSTGNETWRVANGAGGYNRETILSGDIIYTSGPGPVFGSLTGVRATDITTQSEIWMVNITNYKSPQPGLSAVDDTYLYVPYEAERETGGTDYTDVAVIEKVSGNVVTERLINNNNIDDPFLSFHVINGNAYVVDGVADTNDDNDIFKFEIVSDGNVEYDGKYTLTPSLDARRLLPFDGNLYVGTRSNAEAPDSSDPEIIKYSS